jgi:hypothetical protein
MRLVRGRSLADEIRDRPSLEGRLGLLRVVLTATEALAYAHHQGVVHRDVKPQNVMVGAFGEVQVMDWGLAVPIGHIDPGPVGTSAYMSPEQARGEPVTDRSDVWSLGVTLLELVLGRAPEPEGLATTLADLQRRSRSRGRAAPPPELVALIARCLVPDPASRQTTRALADDLARYLDGRRVAAYDYPLSALIARLARAWRVPLIVGAVALIVLGVVLVMGRVRLVAERDRASEALASLLSDQAVAHFQAGRLPEAEDSALGALEVDAPASTRGASARANARGVLMARYAAATRVDTLELPSDCALPRLEPSGRWLLCLGAGQVSVWELAPDGLRLAWTRASTAAHGHILAEAGNVVLVVAEGPTRAGAAAFEDTVLVRLALADGASLGASRPWSPSELARTRTRVVAFNAEKLFVEPGPGDPRVLDFVGPCQGRINALAVSADERRWVVACSDGRLLAGPLGEVPAQSIALSDPGADPALEGPTTMALGASGLAWGDLRGHLGLADLATLDGDRVRAQWRRTLPGAVTRLTMDEVLFAVLADGSVQVVSLDGDDLGSLPVGAATRGLARDGAGRILTLGDAHLTIWTPPPSWLPHRIVLAQGGGLTGAVPSPDGRLLAASTADGHLHVVAPGGRRVASPQPRHELVKPVAWSLDGREVVGTWMLTAGLVTLEAETWRERDPGTRAEGTAFRRALALAGGLIVGVGYDKGSTLYGCLACRADPPELRADAFVDAATSPGGSHAVFVPEASAAVTILDAGPESAKDAAGPRFRRVATRGPAFAGDIGQDGETIVLARVSGAHVLDARTGLERPLAEVGARVVDLAMLDDGQRVAGGLIDGTVVVWSLESGELLARAHAHAERTAFVEALPGGETLVSASWDGTVRLWDLGVLDASPEALGRRYARWGFAR